MNIHVGKYEDLPAGWMITKHTTHCPDGTKIGRIDHFMCGSVKDLINKVKRKIIKDGSEFGVGTYKVELTMSEGCGYIPNSKKLTQTITIKF